jgi:hypothetical protein
MLLFINSKTDREIGDSPSDFTSYFTNPIELQKNSKVAVKSVEIMNTCNNFNEENSILWVATASNPGQEEEAIALHINYEKVYDDLNEIITDLNAQATSVNVPLVFSLNEDNKISVKNNHATTKFRIVSPDEYENGPFNGKVISNGVQYNNIPLFNKINFRLGFTANTRNIIIEPTQSYTAPGIPILLRTTCFYIESSLVDYENQTANPYKSPNILIKIPLLNNYGNLICYEPTQKTYYDLYDFSIDKIKFKVLDDEYNYVDLNGGYFTITLEFK